MTPFIPYMQNGDFQKNGIKSATKYKAFTTPLQLTVTTATNPYHFLNGNLKMPNGCTTQGQSKPSK